MKKGIVVFILSMTLLMVSSCGNESSNAAIENQKENQESTENNSDQEIQSQEITGDLATDVQNGVLYSTEDGKISDKQGNILSEYDAISILDNGSLSDSEGILEGYFIGAGGKVVRNNPDDNLIEGEETEDAAITDDSVNEQRDQGIKKAKAKDKNDFTGTYEDKEDGYTLSLIIEEDKAMYSLARGSGSQPEVEQNCSVDSTGIIGKFYYIVRNMDGSLGISTGVGAPWGHFEKTDDSAEIDLSFDLAIKQEEFQQEYDSQSPLEKMRSRANESDCNNEVVDGMEFNGENLNSMGDDGNYYDEVVLGSWFNDDGSPKAMFPPDGLKGGLNNLNNIYTQLEYFSFINGEDISVDEVKRRGTGGYWYAIILMDIQKQEDEDGNIYFIGTDPISNESVVVKGNFSGILNGDDLLVFGASMGTASDDTLNIRGAYIQNVTARIGSLF